jgi:hypothetical protein
MYFSKQRLAVDEARRTEPSTAPKLIIMMITSVAPSPEPTFQDKHTSSFGRDFLHALPVLREMARPFDGESAAA